MPLVCTSNLSIPTRDVLRVGGRLLSFASRVQGWLPTSVERTNRVESRCLEGRNLADAVSRFQINICAGRVFCMAIACIWWAVHPETLIVGPAEILEFRRTFLQWSGRIATLSGDLSRTCGGSRIP
jgi:hypothetical protein